MVSLDLNDLNIQEAMKAAILQSLSAAARERMIAEALEYLLKEVKVGSGYYATTHPSPLQQAINRAVEKVAQEIALEEVAKQPEFQDGVRRLMGEAIAKVVRGDYDISEAMVETLRTAIRR